MTCDDCPSSVRRTSLTLDPSESSVGSPEAFRNGRIASVTLGAATAFNCVCGCARRVPGASRRAKEPAARQQAEHRPARAIPHHQQRGRDAAGLAVLALTVTGFPVFASRSARTSLML